MNPTASLDDTITGATRGDIAEVRALLCDAIDASPFYGARFKAHERARLNEPFLRALAARDPWYVAVSRTKGVASGVILSIPEHGVLWSSWAYVAPAFRSTGLAMRFVRHNIRHWDDGRFHKMSCIVRPDNTVSRKMLARVGFVETALLKQHLFGEDYWLLERPLTKRFEGYEDAIRIGPVERLRQLPQTVVRGVATRIASGLAPRRAAL